MSRDQFGKTKRVAPSDAEAEAAWKRIMREATQHCLVVSAYGGVATLAVPTEQRKAGLRERVLNAECAEEER